MPRHGQPYVEVTGIPFIEGSSAAELFVVLLRSAQKVIEDGWAISSLAHWHKVASLPSVKSELVKVNNIRLLVDQILDDKVRHIACGKVLLEMAKVLLVIDFSAGPRHVGKGPVEVFVETVLSRARVKEAKSQSEGRTYDDAFKLVGELQRQLVHHLMLHGLCKPELRAHVVHNAASMLLQVWRCMQPELVPKNEISDMYRGMYELAARWQEAKITAKSGDVMMPRVLSLLSLFVRKGVDMYPDLGSTQLYEKTSKLVLQLQKQLQLEAGQYSQLRATLDQGNGLQSHRSTARIASSRGTSSRAGSARSLTQTVSSDRVGAHSARHTPTHDSEPSREHHHGARAATARSSSSRQSSRSQHLTEERSAQGEGHGGGAAGGHLHGVESMPDLGEVQRVLDDLYEQKCPWPTAQSPVLQGRALEALHRATAAARAPARDPGARVSGRTNSKSRRTAVVGRPDRLASPSQSSRAEPLLSSRATSVSVPSAGKFKGTGGDAPDDRERLDVPEGAGFASAGSLDAKERAEASTRVASQFISSNLLKRPGSAPVESSTKVAGTIYTRSGSISRFGERRSRVSDPDRSLRPEESEPPTPEQPTTPTKMSATLAERLSPGWTPLSPATPGGDVYAIPTPGYQSTPQRAPPDKAASASQCTPMSARGDSSDPPSPDRPRRCQTARRGSTRHKYIVVPPSTERIVRTCSPAIIPFLRPSDPPMFRVVPPKPPKKPPTPSQIKPPPTSTCIFNPLTQEWMEPKQVGLTKGWDQDKEIEQTGLSKLIQVKKEMDAKGRLDRSTKDAINMALNKESEHELCNDPNSPKNMRRRKKENQQFLKESLKSLRYMQDVLNKL
ncbi:hypothetical protein CYMTET_53787 [Cymbomonas tetramitiformis]|uniref:Uncharacterized protein n=1 Tax=Cymbomonas tetramitiformis TaxID=36881 RepID=A0AAE0BG67_9CHLO|nr:hypothetical protein CYMTET_53787 [Cymbomonas tetramitiformis]